ncbi:MAG: YfaP family protein [bacterium]
MIDLAQSPHGGESNEAEEETQPGNGDWTRARLGTFFVSLLFHLAFLLILLLFTFQMDDPKGLPIFLRIGDAAKAAGQLQVDPTLFQPIDMPTVEVTKLEPIERPPTLTPDLPRIQIEDLQKTIRPPSEERKKVGLEGFGVSQFEGVSEKVQGVSVKIGDPQFTLIWDSDADLDLHVIEPGGAEIYWEHRQGKRGGELDVDDVDGLGPENVYWKAGFGPRGEYTWWVHYYGGFGGRVRRTKWQVRIKRGGQIEVFEGTLNKIDENSPKKSFRLQ